MKTLNSKLAILPLLIISLLGCGFPDDLPHKSDTVMIKNFQDNKPEFEALLKMIQEDQKKLGGRLFRIDKDWTEPNNLETFGISMEKVAEYRKIFLKLDIQRGFYAYPDGDYSFVSSAQGLGVSGSSKGYWWTKEPPKSLIDRDLDEYHQKQQNPNEVVFRRIEGNWYLERDSS